MTLSLSAPLPFELGETSKGTDDAGALTTPDWLGKKFLISANNISNARIKNRLSGRQLVGIPMRNEAGITMLGKRLVSFSKGGGYNDLKSFDGYGTTLAQGGVGLLDEFLDTGGVADDDIAWVIVGGPAKVLVGAAGAAFNGDIAIGAPLVCATAATSQTSAAGRVSNVTLPGQTGATQAYSMAANRIGTALSARTTQETTAGTDLLVNFQIQL